MRTLQTSLAKANLRSKMSSRGILGYGMMPQGAQDPKHRE